MMQTGQVLPMRATHPPVRVCSGACPFFETAYEMGRKVAGTGVCEKHRSGATVHVGNACLWPRSDKGELVGATATRRQNVA